MVSAIAPSTISAAPAAPPNIVVFYLDDVSSMAGSPMKLWEDPNIAPTVKNLFVDHGIDFTNAIGETSLCCPGRGSLLTGQHTHNHGVLLNDGRLFNPGEHIGKALKDAGYATMFIGKYLNNVNAYSPADWTRDGQGWTYLDVINGRNGDFVKYWLHTKTGSTFYQTHSTKMVADRAVMRMGQVPDNQPLFAVLSVYNMHGPNKPLPEFANDPRCNGYPPYNPPNYNEADVSDKPPSIQALPLLDTPNGWPTYKYCREMLGVDWLVKSVTDELQAEGRLDNTLLVFTADNGMAWGIHRAGQKKSLPYTTPVPLYFHFPSRWGTAPRDVDDLVVNIDLAPTFCDIAGNACHLGPYPNGQTGPDGMSMLPLLDDNPPGPWRSSAIEEHFLGANSENSGFTAWRAIRTDETHARGAWHYVEWGNGFRELYNLETDPWELTNVAGQPSLAITQGLLAVELESLWQEGRPASEVMRPDALIGKAKSGVYYGSHLYSDTAFTNQSVAYTNVPATSHHFYYAQILNRSTDLGSFTINASATGAPAMGVTYTRNGVDVTADITGPGLVVSNVRPGNHVDLTIKINAVNAAAKTTKTVVLTVHNSDAMEQVDVVKAVMSR